MKDLNKAEFPQDNSLSDLPMTYAERLNLATKEKSDPASKCTDVTLLAIPPENEWKERPFVFSGKLLPNRALHEMKSGNEHFSKLCYAVLKEFINEAKGFHIRLGISVLTTRQDYNGPDLSERLTVCINDAVYVVSGKRDIVKHASCENGKVWIVFN